ncbi:MAG TPA: CapA family protein [Candidatus Lustribacter sp.]|nr:CapA family protein [Candidatus Lustribacter sp.]
MTGDVLLHGPVVSQARRDAGLPGARATHGLDFRPLLAASRRVVEGADLAICQLETPLAKPGGPYSGYPTFQVPQDILPALTDTGYDACTTASNHSVDAGWTGLVRTVDALDSAGLKHTGTFRTQREADTPLLLDANGVKVALLNYAYGLNGLSEPAGRRYAVNLISVPAILADAKAARRAGADVVLVALHAGNEYVQAPSAQQRAVVAALTASPDVDLVYGHHVHVVQPFDRVNGKWVAYGLGNLIHNQAHSGNEPTRAEVAARFTFTERAAGGFAVSKAEYIPGSMSIGTPMRYVDLGAALSNPSVPAATKARYRAVQAKVVQAVTSLGADEKGLVLGR